MMYGFSPSIVPVFFLGIHVFAMAAGFTGVILLIGWALKHAPARTVKHWALWLIGIGLVLSILTIPAMFGARGFKGGCFGGDDTDQGQQRNRTFRGWMMGLDADDQASSATSSSSVSSAGW